jgi:hypothetical protein
MITRHWFVPLLLAVGCTVGATSPPPATPTAMSATLEGDIDRPGADYRSFDVGSNRPEECRDACLTDSGCEAFTFVRPGVYGPYGRCWLKGQMVPAVANNCCISGVKSYAGPAPGPQPSPPSAWVGVPPVAAAPSQPAPAPVAAAPPPPPPPRPAAAPPPPPRPAPAPVAPPAAAATPPPSAWVGHPPAPAGGAWEPNVDRPGTDYLSFDLQEPRAELCREACVRDARCKAFTYVNPGLQGPYARCWLKSTVPPARDSTCCISGIR